MMGTLMPQRLIGALPEKATFRWSSCTETAAASLTGQPRIRKLATWFDAANRTRELLQTTVRADLAVAELLLAWRGEDGGAITQARGRA